MQTNLALSASMSSFEVFGNLNSQLPSGIVTKENDRVLSKVVLDEADLYTNLFCPLLEELGNSRTNLKRIVSFIDWWRVQFILFHWLMVDLYSLINWRRIVFSFIG